MLKISSHHSRDIIIWFTLGFQMLWIGLSLHFLGGLDSPLLKGIVSIKAITDGLTCCCDFLAYIKVLGHPFAYSYGTSLISLKDQKESEIKSNCWVKWHNTFLKHLCWYVNSSGSVIKILYNAFHNFHLFLFNIHLIE